MGLKNDCMIESQIISQGITNKRLLNAMQKVDRELFVPEKYKSSSYQDGPIPIGFGQTISQPYIVAYMIDTINPCQNDIVLEIGSGSGYLCSILSYMVKHVYAVEIIQELLEKSKRVIEKLQIGNISLYNLNGYYGLASQAPFDIIIASCASNAIPAALTEQLAPGGRMIIPVEESCFFQKLILLNKDKYGSIKKTELLPVRFVPFVKERL